MKFLVALLFIALAKAACVDDGTEYQTSDVIFGCSAQWGASDINLENDQEVYVMLVPEHVMDLNLTLEAEMDVDIIVKDATNMGIPGSTLKCIVGPNPEHCDITTQGSFVWPSKEERESTPQQKGMTIVYSGDRLNAPVRETVYIPHTDRPLAYTVKALGAGKANAHYAYSGVSPCTGKTGECAKCEDYSGCKHPFTAKCDGSTNVQCVLPTLMPTMEPTMSTFEVLYRQCSQNKSDIAFELEQANNLLDKCADRGISCTFSPSSAPSTQPTFLPSVHPTPGPTTMDPTPNPTPGPTNQPSWSPTCECYDLIPPGQKFWYDALGEKYTCSWYASDATRHCTNEHKNFGYSSKKACCACRGGSCAVPTNDPSVPPTPSPTDDPSVSPTPKPTLSPTDSPSKSPTDRPTTSPSPKPTDSPTDKATTRDPTRDPTSSPSPEPSKTPSDSPTPSPSNGPTPDPSRAPSPKPTRNPSTHPTPKPTEDPTTPPPSTPPTVKPTQIPTNPPTLVPTPSPTSTPSSFPTDPPTKDPTKMPIGTPSSSPSKSPSCECKDFIPAGKLKWVDGYGRGYGCEWYALDVRFCTYDQDHYRNDGFVAKEACCVCGGGDCDEPTMDPTRAPSPQPSRHPIQPTSQPSNNPTKSPSREPTPSPTDEPTTIPSTKPSNVPSNSPFCDPCYDHMVDGVTPWYDAGGPKYTCNWYKHDPERFCEHDGDEYVNFGHTAQTACCVCGGARKNPKLCDPPTSLPTSLPSKRPTVDPTPSPTDKPTKSPTSSPTDKPSSRPTFTPSWNPTKNPTPKPSMYPTPCPSKPPSSEPSKAPTPNPTPKPTPLTAPPTKSPSTKPTSSPSMSPTPMPSLRPTHQPTPEPTSSPSDVPTPKPTSSPTDSPSLHPTNPPSAYPVCEPCYDLVPPKSPHKKWHDPYGPEYDCIFYASDPWRFCNYDAATYTMYGLTAKKACCVCGGGSCNKPSFSPTPKPSEKPSKAPTPSPTTKPTLSPTDKPTTTDPTKSPTPKPTTRPTHSPSPSPSNKPTPIPSLSPTPAPGTDSPTPSPTDSPTDDCWTQLAECKKDLTDAKATCDASKCGKPAPDAYPATIELENVAEAMVTDIDSYVLSKLQESGVPKVPLKVFNDEYVIYDAKSNSYTRTCVMYSTSNSKECRSDLSCGGGSVAGWYGNQASYLIDALRRRDGQHPDCPNKCNSLGTWWRQYLTSGGLDGDNYCVFRNAFYHINPEGLKVYTCVGYGGSQDACENSKLVCAGIGTDGSVTYGWQNDMLSALKAASADASLKHPQCPECCGCSN